MNHPNEDMLLQFVLETLGDADASNICEHLTECVECRALEVKLRGEVGRIGSVDIHVDMPRVLRLPGVVETPFRHWAWVAGLAAGFLLGMLTARLGEDRHPAAVPQMLATKAATSPISGYIPCRAVDLQTFRATTAPKIEN
jgi:hypothetical protein